MGQKYRKKDETIRNNLKQYGLENKFLDIMVADFSVKYIKEDFKFDCIITDPPYGIREKTKRVGPKKPNTESTGTYFPQRTNYNLGDIFNDLVEFSAQHLLPRGRLVFWIPIYLEIDRSKIRYLIILNQF